VTPDGALNGDDATAKVAEFAANTLAAIPPYKFCSCVALEDVLDTRQHDCQCDICQKMSKAQSSVRKALPVPTTCRVHPYNSEHMIDSVITMSCVRLR
jgi:hypothetical protein